MIVFQSDHMESGKVEQDFAVEYSTAKAAGVCLYV